MKQKKKKSEELSSFFSLSFSLVRGRQIRNVFRQNRDLNLVSNHSLFMPFSHAARLPFNRPFFIRKRRLERRQFEFVIAEAIKPDQT